MAVADFLMALLNAGSTWTFNFYYDWWFGQFCSINHFFGVAPTCVSVFTMMVVSWDRSAAVVNPLRKRQMSRRCTLAIISGIWVLAALISLPASIPARIDKQFFYSVQNRVLNERRICHNEFEYKFM
uniref:G_PROTEIN_RECEP_F1_2 domain-containing protein n=1 Tax=Panagrellus redivivus TaxID=6233 RepID=A0A7E4VN36_PANRE